MSDPSEARRKATRAAAPALGVERGCAVVYAADDEHEFASLTLYRTHEDYTVSRLEALTPVGDATAWRARPGTRLLVLRFEPADDVPREVVEELEARRWTWPSPGTAPRETTAGVPETLGGFVAWLADQGEVSPTVVAEVQRRLAAQRTQFLRAASRVLHRAPGDRRAVAPLGLWDRATGRAVRTPRA